jgi:hypothetical protein
VRRAAEIVWYLENTSGTSADELGVSIKDVNMSINWGSLPDNRCPCIVSTSTMWARGLYVDASGTRVRIDRLLCGEEALALQGFGYDLQGHAEDPFAWTSKQKFDLAGNAFAAPCSFPLITAWVALVPFRKGMDAASDLAKKVAEEKDAAVPLADDMDGASEGEEGSESEEGGESDVEGALSDVSVSS